MCIGTNTYWKTEAWVLIIHNECFSNLNEYIHLLKSESTVLKGSWWVVQEKNLSFHREIIEKIFGNDQWWITSRGRHLSIGLWLLGIKGEMHIWICQPILIIPINYLVYVRLLVLNTYSKSVYHLTFYEILPVER